jgi:hypothetical protein
MLVGTAASAAGTVHTPAVEVGALAAVPTAEAEVEAPVGAAALTGVEAPVLAVVVAVAAVVVGGAITKGFCNACVYPYDASVIGKSYSSRSRGG